MLQVCDTQIWSCLIGTVNGSLKGWSGTLTGVDRYVNWPFENTPTLISYLAVRASHIWCIHVGIRNTAAYNSITY